MIGPVPSTGLHLLHGTSIESCVCSGDNSFSSLQCSHLKIPATDILHTSKYFTAAVFHRVIAHLILSRSLGLQSWFPSHTSPYLKSSAYRSTDSVHAPTHIVADLLHLLQNNLPFKYKSRFMLAWMF